MAGDSERPVDIDVLIVGTGISGIDAAYHLSRSCPGKTWLVVEARSRIGGTWDLFRYPGIRSDSDMFTLGFPFRPWPSDLGIVGGEEIRTYVEDTAREFGLIDKMRFDRKVVTADWSSASQRWTVTIDHKGTPESLTCRFLFLCSGYYDYESGYRPTWSGEKDFDGLIVHPQFWPDDLDYRGKRIAVIGSGATAVTIVPAMAETAAHVTMVQRSPSYIVSRPARDRAAKLLQALLPARAAHGAVRWKNVLMAMFFYNLARRRPAKMRDWIARMTSKELPGHAIDPDFAPRYDPWDQRLCLVPDGDLFKAMRAGRASVATGTIDRFTEKGLRLDDGQEIEADIIVTATGLNLKTVGGIALSLDGRATDPVQSLVYKGMMLSGVPNLAIFFGYINASWTLRSDLTARTLTRLLNHMDAHGYRVATPRLDDDSVERRPIIEFSSSYAKRADSILPHQGDRHPWRVQQNYVKDRWSMRFSPIGEALDFA